MATRKLTVEILGDAKGLGKAMSEAEGSTKKLGDELETSGKKSSDFADKAGKAALVAGAAIGAFAVSSVKEFQNLGLEVGKFSDVTQVSAEMSSKWIEVAGDLGVSTGTLETVFNKMNVTAGKSPETFAALGVEIAKTKDGAVDASGTFLNVIDHLNGIKDPARRAEEGTKLLGRGWKETAELVGRGAPQLRKDLDNVADSKVFTDKDVTEARGLRGAFDSIGDAIDELQLKLGRRLAPAVISATEGIVSLIDAVDPLIDVLGDGLVKAIDAAKPLVGLIGDIAGGVSKLVDAIGGVNAVVPVANEGFAEAVIPIYGWSKAIAEADDVTADMAERLPSVTAELNEQAAAQNDLNKMMIAGVQAAYAAGNALQEKAAKLAAAQEAAQRTRDRENELAEATRRVEEKVDDQSAAWRELTGQLDQEETFAELVELFQSLNAEIATATWNAAENAATTAQGMADVAAKVRETKQDVISYGQELGKTPTEVKTYLNLIDNGQLGILEQRLNTAFRNRNMMVSITDKGGIGLGSLTVKLESFDTGGVVPGPRGAPRMILAHGGETVLPTHQTGGAAGLISAVINVNVQTLDPKAAAPLVVEALRVHVQRNGPGSLSFID